MHFGWENLLFLTAKHLHNFVRKVM